MPVRKFRSVAEMPGPRPRQPLDPQNLQIACELSELAYALHPWRLAPGIHKFASAEAASLHRERWRLEQVRNRGRLTPSPVVAK